jgi:hypothetical protein
MCGHGQTSLGPSGQKAFAINASDGHALPSLPAKSAEFPSVVVDPPGPAVAALNVAWQRHIPKPRQAHLVFGWREPLVEGCQWSQSVTITTPSIHRRPTLDELLDVHDDLRLRPRVPPPHQYAEVAIAGTFAMALSKKM